MSILALSDLNTTINHEPRISHMKLATTLGYEQLHKFTHLIERNIAEFEKYGSLSSTVDDNKKGRKTKLYFLNEAQAILSCMFSRTQKAAEVRKAIIEVFMAWRRGQLTAPEGQTINKKQIGLLYQAVLERAGEDRKLISYIWSRFKNHYKLAAYKDLPATQFEEALEYIKGMPAKEQKNLPFPVVPSEICEGLDNLWWNLQAFNAINMHQERAPWLISKMLKESVGMVNQMLDLCRGNSLTMEQEGKALIRALANNH